ncbi:MAG TPA: TonB-dependent receptor [Thermoanaerobaculia bacterium]|nr:TonB-dependent receptor [Thermoanaerobaculia bacterium]
MKSSSAASIILLTFALPLFGQFRDEIVVTASSVPETVEETPAAVSVVTREEIDRRAATGVADLLREVPGVMVARTGSSGKATSLFLRGGSSKQALVLWNGIEMNNPYFSGYDFGQMSTAGVERVEVVRGPFSALYGSDAVSGVVNVLTTPRSSGGRIEVEGGEQGWLNAQAAGGVTAGAWSAHAAVERRSDDGFAPNDAFDSSSVLGGATVQMTGRVSLGVLARHSAYELGIPMTPSADLTEFVASPERRQEGSEMQFALPLRYDRGTRSFELKLSESRRTEEFADVAGPFGPEASDTTSRIRSARGAARYGSLTVGGEYEMSTVDHVSNFSLIDERDRRNRSAFVEQRMSFDGGVELAAGLRYDDFESFGSELSPRVAAAWVRSGTKLRVAYGEGFRAPAIGELYSPFFGNAGLDAERSGTVEIGLDRFFAAGHASVTVFRSDYDELIVFGDDFRFQNIAAADAHGVELAAARRFGGLRMAGSYTWLRTEDAATGEALIRRPEHSGSFSIGYDLARLSTQLVVAHTGERADVTDLIPFGRVTSRAYTAADIVVSYRAAAWRPFVKIENVTGEEYQEVFGYPSPARRLRLGVRYTFP